MNGMAFAQPPAKGVLSSRAMHGVWSGLFCKALRKSEPVEVVYRVIFTVPGSGLWGPGGGCHFRNTEDRHMSPHLSES